MSALKCEHDSAVLCDRCIQREIEKDHDEAANALMHLQDRAVMLGGLRLREQLRIAVEALHEIAETDYQDLWQTKAARAALARIEEGGK